MAGLEFVLARAAVEDAPGMAACFLDSFTVGPAEQSRFFARLFPHVPSTQSFFAESFAEQIRREPRSHFMKVVERRASSDGSEGSAKDEKIVGFCKWTPPDSDEAFWADYASEMDASLCDEFFGAMAEHREKLTVGKPHWYMEILGVAAAYQRKGIGKKMMAYGCALVDTDDMQAYVDSSPSGKGLYESFGFESLDYTLFSEPFEWYREEFMIRPPASQRK